MRRFLALLLAALTLGVGPAQAAPPSWSSGVFSGHVTAAAPPASPAFVSAKVINDATTSTTWPASATGNLVIVQIFSFGTACGPPSSAGGSWTQLQASTAWPATSNETALYYRVVNSTDTGSNLSFTGTCAFSGAGIYVYSNVTTAVLQSTQGTASGNDLVLTGFSATGATKGVVVTYMIRGGAPAETISGFTGDSVDDATWAFGVMSIWHNFSYSSGNVTVTGGSPSATPAYAALIELQ